MTDAAGLNAGNLPGGVWCFGFNHCRGSEVERHGLWLLLGQCFAPRWVRSAVACHHLFLGVVSTEEKSFGCEVLVHSSMKIKMILRQVSETDYFELQSKRSFICHSVRRNFHGSCGDRRFPHQGNQAVQVGGFWCGEL